MRITTSARKTFEASSATNMATRESLKKLPKPALQKLCIDLSIEFSGCNKEELIGKILTCSIPVENITPVLRQDSVNEELLPTENLPPFNKVRYSSANVDELPCPSFLQIYNFMIVRKRGDHDGGDTSVSNFKGMDRAVRHFEAGDIQDVKLSRVSKRTSFTSKCRLS